MSEPSSTTDAATGMSTNAFLEARRPTLARRMLSLLVSVYGIVWAVICMIPIIVAIYLILQCASHLHDWEGLVRILDDILTETAAGSLRIHSDGGMRHSSIPESAPAQGTLISQPCAKVLP